MKFQEKLYSLIANREATESNPRKIQRLIKTKTVTSKELSLLLTLVPTTRNGLRKLKVEHWEFRFECTTVSLDFNVANLDQDDGVRC